MDSAQLLCPTVDLNGQPWVLETSQSLLISQGSPAGTISFFTDCLHVQGRHYLTIPSHAENACCLGGRAIFSKRLSTQPRKPGNNQHTSLLSTVQTVYPQESTFSRQQKVMPSSKVMVQNDSPLNGSYFSLILELASF